MTPAEAEVYVAESKRNIEEIRQIYFLTEYGRAAMNRALDVFVLALDRTGRTWRRAV